MDNIFSLTVTASASHFLHTPTTTLLTYKPHTSSLSFSLRPPPPPPPPPPEPHNIRRPKTPKKVPPKSNPLKNLVNSTIHVPSNKNPLSLSLSSKLRLSSKLSPPPPPPPPPPVQEADTQESETSNTDNSNSLPSSDLGSEETEFRQTGKIFVGNLPNWIKKQEFGEFFRQFGPIKNVILIKGYNEYEKNVGFGFVIYDGPVAKKCAVKAVEFDGVEFHGRVLTVKLDDGRRLKNKAEERARWVAGVNNEGEEFRSEWHKGRERDRREFRKAVESRPENWQAVVSAFERIKKVYGFAC